MQPHDHDIALVLRKILVSSTRQPASTHHPAATEGAYSKIRMHQSLELVGTRIVVKVQEAIDDLQARILVVVVVTGRSGGSSRRIALGVRDDLSTTRSSLCMRRIALDTDGAISVMAPQYVTQIALVECEVSERVLDHL